MHRDRLDGPERVRVSKDHDLPPDARQHLERRHGDGARDHDDGRVCHTF